MDTEITQSYMLAVRIKGRLRPILTGRGTLININWAGWKRVLMPPAKVIMERAFIEEADALRTGKLKEVDKKANENVIVYDLEKHRGLDEKHRGSFGTLPFDTDSLGLLPIVVLEGGKPKGKKGWEEVYSREELEALDAEMRPLTQSALSILALRGPVDGMEHGLQVYKSFWNINGVVEGGRG